MPFRIGYTPIGALGQAAAAAGQAQAAQTAAAQDTGIIRQQMAIRAQLAQAAMARDMRQQEMDLRERAMQMQEAAAARMERTPTARKSGVSPVAAAIQARLVELDKLKTSGGLPDPTYQDARLRIITGQRTPQPRATPQPRQLSYTERRTEARERADTIAEAKRLSRSMNQSGISEARRLRLAETLTGIVSQATQRWGRDWRTQPAAWMPKHARTKAGATVTSLPYDRGQLRRGKVYQLPDGRLGSWTGTRFKIVGD